jgi:predicted nucleic acid-binding protein
VSRLFDSTILIAHLRGDRRATDLLLETPRAERLVSVLSRVEIEGGMRSAERQDVATLFSYLRMKPVTDAIARRAGWYLRKYRNSHRGVDIVDYVIAATAEHAQADLVTLNVKRFPMIAELACPW